MPPVRPRYTLDRARGRSSRKNQVLLIQQGSGEVVDWPDGAQRHGVVLAPQQVGAKHHGQVAVGHLVHLTVGWYLWTQIDKAWMGTISMCLKNEIKKRVTKSDRGEWKVVFFFIIKNHNVGFITIPFYIDFLVSFASFWNVSPNHFPFVNITIK